MIRPFLPNGACAMTFIRLIVFRVMLIFRKTNFMIRKKIKKVLSVNDDLYNKVRCLGFSFSSFLSLFITDKKYLKIQYFLRLGKKLNLDQPVLFNEKIQWYKLNYKNPLLHQCVDKWEVRSYIESKGYGDILIPAYGPFESIYEIDINKLPDSFIVKLTNGSGFNEICFEKNKVSIEYLENKFKKWKKINFYHSRREWAYKDVKNRIMCEHLLCDKTLSLPPDLRFFCFDGVPKLIAIDLESVKEGRKTSNYYRHLFTPEWKPIDALIQYPNKDNYLPDKPDNLKRMLKIAQTLSEDFPFVRVDLYNDKGRIYFGELTFYHASGYQNITPESFEIEMGNWFNLDYKSIIK